MLYGQMLINTSNVFPMKNGSYGNNGILRGKGAMPCQPYPSSCDNIFSLNRNAFTRIANTLPKNTRLPNNPVYIQDASSRTMMMRINAIGKSSINTNGGKLGFSKEDRNVVNHSLVKARRIGSAAPAKKSYYARF